MSRWHCDHGALSKSYPGAYSSADAHTHADPHSGAGADAYPDADSGPLSYALRAAYGDGSV